MIDLSKLTESDIGRWVKYRSTGKIGQIKRYCPDSPIVEVLYLGEKKIKSAHSSTLDFIEPPDKELFE